jgi:hypothetical protein
VSQKPHHRQPHGGQAGKPTEHHGSSPEELAAINQTFIAFAEKYNKGDEKHPRREYWKFVLEICVAVGVGVYTVITGGLLIASWYQLRASADQIRASQDQLATMKDTEIRQLRAYLHVSRASVTYVEVVNGPLKVAVTPTYKIFGQTPAGGVIPRWNLDVQPFPMNDKFPFNMGTFPAPTTTIDAPGEERITDTKELLLSADDIAKINAGTHRLYIYGTILYVDIFKFSRYTNFCFHMDIASIKQRNAANCEIHNGADWYKAGEKSVPVEIPMR